ncbi:MAG: methyltransferase domain-containing protein [Xanthomonadales bacterium]|nr:methyltransferase domain-containing protein [Xanthomonadales bacterium]
MSQDFATYKAFWDHQARDRLNAMLAVDGSGDDEVLLCTGQYTADQVVAALDLQPSDRVLELGCGVGRIGSELAARVGHWQGVDISQKMIDVARDRLSGFSNVSADVLERTRLDPAADQSLDKAYSVAVFIHLDKEDLFLYLQDLYRALKPGGRIYFDTWNIAHPVGFRRFAYEVNRFRDQAPVARKDVARNQFSCPQEIEIYLQQAGFEVAMMLADSPWIQAVAVKPGGSEPLEQIKGKLAAQRDTIIYGAGWTEFFDRLLQTIFEGVHPQALYDSLRARQGDREADMFATWLRGFWKLSEAQFGPAPAA